MFVYMWYREPVVRIESERKSGVYEQKGRR